MPAASRRSSQCPNNARATIAVPRSKNDNGSGWNESSGGVASVTRYLFPGWAGLANGFSCADGGPTVTKISVNFCVRAVAVVWFTPVMQHPLVIGTNSHVAAIDPNSGQELWRTKIQSTTLGSGSDVSVLVKDGFIFAGSNGRLICLDHASGNILWSNELKGLSYNDVSLAMEGVSVQFLQKVVHQNSSSS